MFPINFSIPKEKICNEYTEKTKILSDLIPGYLHTYIYNTEEDYYNEYKKSYFAITKLKGGWDCMRHYEILANGCIPYFLDINMCPINTMVFLPKELIIQGIILYNNKFNNKKIDELTEETINKYNILRTKLLDHTKKYLTTEKMSEYILNQTNFKGCKKILYLSGNVDPDYLRCLMLHGFKSILGSNCHDYPKISHMYKDNNINHNLLYGKGMSYASLLDPILRDDNLDNTIFDDIKNKYYDIVIYGSYHRGMPHYDLVSTVYKPNEIILLCGEDLHECNSKDCVNMGHSVFVREQ